MSDPSSHRSHRKRGLVIATGATLTLIAALLVLVLRFERAAAPGEVASALQQAWGGAADTRVRVGRTELDLWQLRLLAHDVVVEGARGPLLRARQLRLRPSLGALLRGRVDLRSVELDAAELHLRAGELSQVAHGLQGGALAALTLSAAQARVIVESAQLGTLQLEHADLALRSRGAALGIELTAAAGTWLRGARRESLSHVQLQGAFEASGLHIAQLVLEMQGARLALRDAQLPFAAAAPAVASVELDAPLERLLALELLDGVPSLSGGMQLRGRFTLSAGQLSGSGALELVRARVSGLELGERVRLVLRADAQGMQLAGALPLAGATAAEAPLSFSTTPRLVPEGLALEALSLKRGGSELRGRAQLGRDGVLTLALSGDTVALEDGSPLLGAALARAGLRGRGKLAIDAHGPLAAPEARIALNVTGFAAYGMELGALDAVFDVQERGRTLRFERASLEAKERKVDSEALLLQIDGAALSASARLRIARMPLADVYALLGASRDPALSRLQASGRGSARFELGHAGDEQLELDLALEQPSFDGYRFDAGKLRARFAEATRTAAAAQSTASPFAAGTLALQELTLRSGGGTLRLSGEIRSGGELDLAISAEQLELARLPWLHAHLPQLAGEFGGSGRLSGSTADPRAALELAVEPLKLGGGSLGGLRLHAELRAASDPAASPPDAACPRGRAALAQGALGAGTAWLFCGAGLAGRAHVDLAAGGGPSAPLRGTIELARLDLAGFLPAQDSGVATRGELDAVLRIDDGSLAAPELLSGALAVQRLEFGSGALAFANRAPFELAITRGALSLAGAELVAPKAALMLSAAGNLKQGAKLTAQGKVPASVLASFLPGVRDVHGELAVRLEYAPSAQSSGAGAGTSAAAALQGSAEWHDGIVRLAGGGYVRKIAGKLVLDGEQVRVEDAHAELGGGTLSADGTLQLQGLRLIGYDLQLAAEQVAIEPQERLEVAFDARGRLQSQPNGAAPLLSGRVTLHSALYTRHIELPDALIALNRDERVALATYDPAHDRLRFELEFEAEQPLQIRNDFLDAEVALVGPASVLKVSGSDQRFGLVGKLEVVRGRLLYRGDQFQITRSQVAFEDATRIAPRFDLRAVATSKKRPDANIVLAARGDRDAFGLTVSCDAKGGAPPPFSCDFAQDRLRCDRFEELVRLWVCRADEKLSSAP